CPSYPRLNFVAPALRILHPVPVGTCRLLLSPDSPLVTHPSSLIDTHGMGQFHVAFLWHHGFDEFLHPIPQLISNLPECHFSRFRVPGQNFRVRYGPPEYPAGEWIYGVTFAWCITQGHHALKRLPENRSNAARLLRGNINPHFEH